MKGATAFSASSKLGSLFQSSLPMKGATYRKVKQEQEQVFQSSLPMKGATKLENGKNTIGGISILAPDEGSD